MITQELLASLAVFDLSRAELESTTEAVDFKTCSAALNHDVQKVYLLFAHNELPPWDSKDGQAIAKQYVGLCFAVGRQCALRSAGGCRAFRRSTKDAFQAIVEASCAFFQLVGAKDRPQKEGAVMEKCKMLETVPRDNRTATSRALVRLGSSIKDVVRELGEMKESEPKLDDADEDVAEVDEDDEFEFNPSFDETEARIAAQAVPMAHEALQLLKPVMRALLDAPEPSSTDEEGLARLDALCTVYKQIALAAEEVGASLYPPQEISELIAHCSALASAATSFGQIAAEMPGVSPETQAAVRQAVEEVCKAKEAFAAALTGSCAEAA